MESSSLRKEILVALLFAALSLFVIPLGTWLFTGHAQADRDSVYTAALLDSLEKDQGATAEDKQAGREFLAAHPPSAACTDDTVDAAAFRRMVCDSYSELWQYHFADKVALASLVGGVIVLLAIFGLGALAFFNRGAQYLSLMVGWNLLRVAGAAQVITQGALLVWLSYWLTAFFFDVYAIKLILLVAVVAGAAVLHAIVGIFRRPPPGAPMAGRLIGEQDAPKLWAHLKRCAGHLNTAPPQHLVAGIDANFFVTEAPLAVGASTLTGRSLYVSLPLLRVLDRAEADAVLIHELAHFRGGDTASSAKLGPKLLDFDHYCGLMLHGGATIIVFYVMNLYRLILQLALSRDSRQREFLADRVASKVISPRAISQSLIKVAAYSNYRSQVERQLFDQDTRHGNSLGISGRVAAGLAPYATSGQFVDSMKSASVPHPFDSHPPLAERMRNVGHEIEERDFGAIVMAPPAEGWISDIPVAGTIETDLWNEYERLFTDAHDNSLAYRYLPANDEERAVVLRYFPDVRFDLRKAAHVDISFRGLSLPGDEQLLRWDDIKDFSYENGMGADVLTIRLNEKGMLGAKTRKVKLPGISKRRDEFQHTLGLYWHRHQTMRQSIPL
jgi:Zn-dependent protease with chaperone function